MLRSKTTKKIFDQLLKIVVGESYSEVPLLAMMRAGFAVSLAFTMTLSWIYHVFETPYLIERWGHINKTITIPGVVCCYLFLRFSSIKQATLSYVAYSIIMCYTWYLCVDVNAEVVNNYNYHRYLPLISLALTSYYPFLIMKPKLGTLIVLWQTLFIGIYPLIADPNSQSQLSAFVIFAMASVVMFFYYLFTYSYNYILLKVEQQALELNHANRLGIIGRAASSIAHDYNNLLSIGMNNLELIDREKYAELWDEQLSNVAMSFAQAREISHKLLNIGKSQSKLQHSSLKSILMNLENFLRSLAGDQISLNVRCEHDVVVLVSRVEIESSIVNIVLNAKNAMRGRPGKIDIYTVESHNKVAIVIDDDGPGIPKDIQSRIFEPFFSTYQEEMSTGLGLSIVKNFLSRCGGEVTFETSDKGTKFFLTLPISSAVLSEGLESEKDQKPKFRPSKILLIDDNKLLIKSMSILLEKKGYKAFETDDWDMARKIVRENNDLDVVFIDFSMPSGEGLDLGRELIEISRRPHYFLLTGGGITEDIETNCLSAGFSDVLQKPLDIIPFLEGLEER